MSARSLLDRLAGRAVERAFGEPVVIQPMKAGPNAAPSIDPDRPPRTIQAVISIAPEDRALFADRKGGTNSVGPTRVSVPGIWASLTAAELEALDRLPDRGDVVVLVSRAGQPHYRISQVDIDDVGAALLELARTTSPN